MEEEADRILHWRRQFGAGARCEDVELEDDLEDVKYAHLACSPEEYERFKRFRLALSILRAADTRPRVVDDLVRNRATFDHLLSTKERQFFDGLIASETLITPDSRCFQG